MSDFRIFCELLAKMMLKAIDFTDVVEVYRRNEKPEILGIATIIDGSKAVLFCIRRNEKPEILGIATTNSSPILSISSGRNEKPEVV